MKRGKLSISSFDQRSGGAGYFACESKAMAVGRTILAILIAVSVALLPAAAGAAFKMQAAQAMEISATQQMDDGCPGHPVLATKQRTTALRWRPAPSTALISLDTTLWS